MFIIIHNSDKLRHTPCKILISFVKFFESRDEDDDDILEIEVVKKKNNSQDPIDVDVDSEEEKEEVEEEEEEESEDKMLFSDKCGKFVPKRNLEDHKDENHPPENKKIKKFNGGNFFMLAE